MKNVIIKGIWVVVLMLNFQISWTQTYVTIDPNNPSSGWLGYMNIFNLPADGGAAQSGQSWSIANLNASFDTNGELCLSPNTIGDPNEYWYQCVGGSVPPQLWWARSSR